MRKRTQQPTSMCEYDEININRYAISKDHVMKKIQLGALFILFKNKYPSAEYTIETTQKTFNIPEEFYNPEILAISKFFEVKEWHIFIDEEHYIDIDFDFLKVNGELSMIEDCKETITKIEKYKSDIDIHSFNFNKYSGWLWDKYLENQYDTCIKLGNKYLKFGDFYVYDDEGDEYKISTKEDFEKISRKTYILLKSKLNNFKLVLIDMELRQVIATELDSLEKEYLSDLLHPELE